MKHKSLFLIIICLFTLVLNLIVLHEQNTENSERLIMHQLDTSHHFLPFKLPFVPHSHKQFEECLTILNACAKQEHLNYMEKHVHRAYPRKNGKLDYAHWIHQQKFYVYNLSETKFLQNFGIFDTNKTKYSYTYPPLDGYQVTIEPISQALHSDANFEGIFFLETLDQNKFEHFITTLNQKVTQKFKQKYPDTAYIPTAYPELLLPNFETNIDMLKLINYLELFLVASLLLYFILQQHSISLYKLNGWSFGKTFKQITLAPLSLIILSTISLDFLAIFQGSALTDLFLKQLLLLSFIILFSLFTLALMYTISLARVKEKIFNSASLWILGITKLLLLTTVIMSLAPLGQLLFSSYNFVTARHSDLRDYAEFFPLLSGSNREDLPFSSDELQVYRQADRSGALYIDDSDSSYMQPKDVPRPITAVTLNLNYLKLHPIRDIHGRKIHISPHERREVLIIPRTKKHFLPATTKYRREISKTAQENGILIIYSEPKYNRQLIDISSEKNIANEIISVITPETQKNPKLILNIMTGSTDDPLLLPLKGSIATMNKHWQSILRKYNLSDNLPQLIRYDKADLEELKISLGNVLSELLSQLLLLAIVFMISFYSMLTFFTKNLYSIGLKNAFGFSRLRNYWRYWALMVLQYALTALFSFEPELHLSKVLYFILVGLCAGIELIFMNHFINYLERKAIQNVH